MKILGPVSASPMIVKTPHVHGADCKHDHDGHDHHGHDHHDHDHHSQEEHEAALAKPTDDRAEDGGDALQFSLSHMLPGETDDLGRFEKMQAAMLANVAIRTVHLRKSAGAAQVCVHYDPAKLTRADLITHAIEVSRRMNKRYVHRTWFVRGMEAAQCADVIEYALRKTNGVLSANVAYAAERLKLEWDRTLVGQGEFEKRLAALGFELEDAHAGHACSHHAHGGGLAPKLAMPLSITSGVLLALGFGAEKLSLVSDAMPVYVVALLCAGAFPARDAFNSLRQFRLDIESLMVLAAIGASVLGAYFEGAFLLFLFSIGHTLEHRIMDRARRAIDSLGQLRPETARRVSASGIVEVPLGQVARGDRIEVRPGDRVPLDGVVRKGASSVDQATLTGESIPVVKNAGSEVFAGTLNVEGSLEIEVTKLAQDSALARMIDLVSEAETQKSKTQRFAQRIERRFVPLVIIATPVFAAILIMLGTGTKEAMLRAVSLLVAASPCALAISTPAAVLSAVARAARSGVLFKGGAHLETLGTIRTVAFDKTGTLTKGKPEVQRIHVSGVSEETLLRIAASAEASSAHPLALAITGAAKQRQITLLECDGLEAIHGKGIRAKVDGQRVSVGSLAMFTNVPETVRAQVTAFEEAGLTSAIVEQEGSYLGVLGIADALRPEASEIVRSLKALGVTHTVMLSGDNNRVAKAVAAQVGLTDTRAPLMPEEKVRAIQQMKSDGGVAMVGDGVNDAPALAAASVGVSMGGAASDAALEAADVVLMSEDLKRLPFAIQVARAATAVIRQNLIISLGVSAVLMCAAVFGWVHVAEAVVLHEGSTIFVVLNGLRLLALREKV